VPKQVAIKSIRFFPEYVRIGKSDGKAAYCAFRSFSEVPENASPF
jgi:hypothetical protein